MIDDLARSRHELEALGRQRGWRQRDDRRVRKVVLTNPIQHLEGRVEDVGDALDHARQRQRQHRDYLREHRHELRRLPDVEQTIDTRNGQLVDADLAHPPPYLRALGPKPNDASQLADWRHAAEYVERYRIRHGITDPHQPLGPKPSGDATLWRFDMRDLTELAARARTPERAREQDVGIGLG